MRNKSSASTRPDACQGIAGCSMRPNEIDYSEKLSTLQNRRRAERSSDVRDSGLAHHRRLV